ncbi:Autophagy-related protein 17 [Rhypophila sp. PSN 637]
MSTSSSSSSLEPHSHATSPRNADSTEHDPEDVPVEVLVKHLLAAKQSLSSITLVLRANELANMARQMHEESAVLVAETGFLRHGIEAQVRILRRVRRGLSRVYDNGKRDLKQLLRTLDGANAKLQQTMQMLRNTTVDKVFRPPGEDRKNLMDFIDEQSVDVLVKALKESVVELTSAQTSFDGDLLRFDNDLRLLNKTAASAPSSSPDSSTSFQPMSQLLAALSGHSHDMAGLLTSLTRHFDMCVKAVSTTEGGAALALRRAAEVTERGDPLSISGAIAAPGTHLSAIESIDPQERAEIIQVVLHDATEVDEVVAEIQAVLQQMELDFGALQEQADRIKGDHTATLTTFAVLEDIGSRLQGYMDAEAEFLQRWEDEKDIIFGKLQEMDELRKFYDGYASAYDSLTLEVERRRSAEDKIRNIWRKAKESVDKIVEADRREREQFRQDIGDFLPTDLWVGMNHPLKRWEVVPIEEAPSADSDIQEHRFSRELSTPRPM